MDDQTMTSKTARFTVDEGENSRPASMNRESSASSTSMSSRKSVRFADETASLPSTSPTHAARAVCRRQNEEQSSGCSFAASSVTSSIKKVSFVDDDMEKPHPVTFPRANTPDDTDKEKVKLANDDVRSEAQSGKGSPNRTKPCSQTLFNTLLDADTSLETPLESPDSPCALTSPTSFSSTTIQCSGSPSFPSPEPYPNPTPTPTSPHHPHITQEDINTSALPFDPGEKDAQGRVLDPSTAPCERCGGKVVWATKGEWLLICEGCGEPQ